MIDTKDTATGDLVGGIPKRRGRPPTGKAKTGAQRMRAMRTRAIHRLEDLKSMPISSLLEELSANYRRGHFVIFDEIVEELRARIPDKSSQ